MARFCCSVFLTFGQHKSDVVHGMFDESADLQWVRHMEGTINDAHPITVSLGFDGMNYKGKLVFGYDSTSFDLIGVMAGARLISSARMKFENIGPFLTEKLVVAGL